MDEQIQEDDLSIITSNMVSHRSPTFNKDEVKVLVDLVEKYKNIILNKCTNSTTNHAKEVAWTKISKELNKKNLNHPRNVHSLKMKWENLKKEARKMSKNLIHFKSDEGQDNDILYKIISMIGETEKSMGINEIPQDLLEEINDMQEDNEEEFSKVWDGNNEKQTNDSSDDEDGKAVLNRSLNFSPQECSLLLKCVRDEKKQIFNKDRTGRAIKMKNNAWTRVTYSFNKLSPEKRTTKMLRTKFENMKRLARMVNVKNFVTNNKQEKLVENSNKRIKSEPHLEYNNDIDSDNDDEDGNDNDFHEMGISNDHCQEQLDPLSTVLKGDSGIDSVSHNGSCSSFENKEVVKLKLELLKYRLENAKLERQRIVEMTEAESAMRESRAIEAALRMRTARLALVAAELQLAPAHPALRYTPREAPAQRYLADFSNDIEQ